MSGEHVGTTSGLIITSGKSEIWPLAASGNQDLESCENSQGREKDLGEKRLWINSICEEAGRCQVCWERRLLIFFPLLL